MASEQTPLILPSATPSYGTDPALPHISDDTTLTVTPQTAQNTAPAAGGPSRFQAVFSSCFGVGSVFGVRGHLLHFVACVLNLAAVFTLVIAVTTQHWMYTTLENASKVQWGLWQLCCSETEFECVEYSTSSRLAVTCGIKLTSSALSAIHVAQALAVFCFLGLTLSCTMNMYACVQPRKWKLIALIINGLVSILSLVLLCALSTVVTKDFAAVGSHKQVIAWSFGLTILVMFLAALAAVFGLLHRIFAVSFLDACIDAWGSTKHLMRLHPLATRMPLYIQLIFALTADVISHSLFSYNALLFSSVAFAIMDRQNVELQKISMLALAFSLIIDVTVAGVYGPDIVKSDTDGDRFSFAVNLLAIALKPFTLFAMFLEYQHNAKAFSQGVTQPLLDESQSSATAGHVSQAPNTFPAAPVALPTYDPTMQGTFVPQSDLPSLDASAQANSTPTQRMQAPAKPPRKSKSDKHDDVHDVAAVVPAPIAATPPQATLAPSAHVAPIVQVGHVQNVVPIQQLPVYADPHAVSSPTNAGIQQQQQQQPTTMTSSVSPALLPTQPVDAPPAVQLDDQGQPIVAPAIFHDNDQIFSSLTSASDAPKKESVSLADKKAARAARRAEREAQRAEQEAEERALIQADLKASKRLIEEQMALRQAQLELRKLQEQAALADRLARQATQRESAAAHVATASAPPSAPAAVALPSTEPVSVIDVGVPATSTTESVAADSAQPENAHPTMIVPIAVAPILEEPEAVDVVVPPPTSRRRALSLTIPEEPTPIKEIDDADLDNEDADTFDAADVPYVPLTAKPTLKRSYSSNPKDKPIKPRITYDLRHTSRRAAEGSTSKVCTKCGRSFADSITRELHDRNEHGSRSRSASSLALHDPNAR